MIRLSVNLNKIALIRNARSGDYPSLVDHAQRCIAAGVHGITVHPRPDQRHIRASDIEDLKTVLNQHPEIEFNIEGNPAAGKRKSERSDVDDYPGFLALVEQARPAQCTLVPDNDAQLTSDHGFDLRTSSPDLAAAIKICQSNGSRVSLFMDPEPEQIKRAAELGVERIELYTGPYAEACHAGHGEKIFERYCVAAESARACGLAINAGHDLNLKNLVLFKQLPHLQEVSIGQAFTVDCLEMGLAATAQAYLNCLNA